MPPVTDSKTIEAVTGLKMEQTFVFFDHRHTRGANILLPDHARAFISAGIDSELDLFLQGAMRMRGLAKGQCVEAVIPKGLIGTMNKVIGKDQETFTFQKLLLFTMLNKFSLRKDKYLKSYLQMLEAEVRTFILFHCLNTDDPIKKDEIFQKTRSLFIRDVTEKLFVDFIARTGKVDVEEYLGAYIDNLMKVATAATENQNELDKLNKKLQLYKNYGLKNSLFPSQVLGFSKGDHLPPGSTVQQVRQQQVQQQVQQQQQQIQQHQVAPANTHKEKEWDFDALKEKTVANILPDFVIPMKDVQCKEMWKKWTALLNDKLLVSKNFLMTKENHISLYDDPAKKPIYEILLLRESLDAPWNAVLLSAEEAKSLRQEINNAGRAISVPMAVVSNSGFVVAKTKATEIKPLEDSQVKEFLLVTHILNGNMKVLIQKEWKGLLKEWLRDALDKKLLLLRACITDSYQINVFNDFKSCLS